MNLTLKSIFTFLSLALIFISCADETVKNNEDYDFDPPRYEFEVDTLYNTYIIDGWLCDTNKLFYVTFTDLLKYDGSNYTNFYLGNSYEGYCISGIDENNVYVGGTYIQGFGKPFLKKFTGGAFTTFLTGDSISGGFFTVYCKTENEIWLSEDSGKVHKFDGSNFELYTFNPDYWYIKPFLKDASGSIYFAGETHYGNPIDSFRFELWKYDGTGWNAVYNHIWEENFYTHNISDEIYSVTYTGIHKFNGSSFAQVLPVNAFFINELDVAGVSMQNLFCAGFDYHEDYFFHFNGAKWSQEYQIKSGQNVHFMHSTENTFHAVIYDFNLSASLVIKGRKRK